MTTAALVRAAWKTNVWDNAALTALTSRAHNFDLMEIAEVSNAHAALMYHGQQINFFQYRVTKAREKQLSASRILYTISVHTQYFLEATTDTSGSNYNAVEDAIETHLRVIPGSADRVDRTGQPIHLFVKHLAHNIDTRCHGQTGSQRRYPWQVIHDRQRRHQLALQAFGL